MDISLTSQLGIKGHLTIHKVANGTEELVYDEDNVIVSGFGWALAHLYGGVGSTVITDYQIDRMKLGTSGGNELQVSSTTDLSGALSATAQYVGYADSNISTIEANLWENNAVAAGTHIYARIPSSKVTKVDDRTVRYTIFIDEDSCNGLDPLNEIGLFIKNPKASASETSVMAAYRYFSNIVKTSDFGLVFRWVISFG